MNKNKFYKKCQELADYEDEVLNFAKNNLAQYVLPLKQKNLCLDICLTWTNYNSKNPGEDIFTNRISFEDGYHCQLFTQIRRNEDPFPDWDLVTIFVPAEVTMISFGAFRWQVYFIKNSLKKIQKQINEMERIINKVLIKGYQEVMAEGY